MTFDEASQALTNLIDNLKSATTTTEIADATSALSAFRADLPLFDKTLRPLRKIARAALEEYDGVVTGLELQAIQQRTNNYRVLVAKLNQINHNSNAAEFAPKLEAATHLISITLETVEMVKNVKETGVDKLTADELREIDNLLDLITKIPDRLLS